MDKILSRRLSALEGKYSPGHYGDQSKSNIIFLELRGLVLYQLALWPD